MTDQNPLPSSLQSASTDSVGRLLAAVAKIADVHPDLVGRRTELLTQLIELTSAAGGIWTWGVSDDTAQSIAPIASVEAGLTDSEVTTIINVGMDPAMYDEFRMPAMQLMQAHSSCLGTTLRTDLHDDQAWKKTRMFDNLIAGGFDEWIHSVRYSGSETWSSLFLVRRNGKAPFDLADQQLIELAMRNVPWLGSTLDNTLPVESTVALTSRQRVVLMMQLDGLSRKQIAGRLEISVDTVGDHIKKIHENFGISSAGELAALFLRKR